MNHNEEYTVRDATIGKKAVGYTVNVSLSPSLIQKVQEIQRALQDSFGDAIIPMPADSLHSTLLDWLAPLVEYGQEKDTLFEQHFNEYDEALTAALDDIAASISVHFSEVRVSQNAVFIVGTDKGEFASIRRKFLDQVDLLPDTKRPPIIIHSTIARFANKVPIRALQKVVEGVSLSVVEKVDHFRLTRESVIPMQTFTTIKDYRLR